MNCNKQCGTCAFSAYCANPDDLAYGVPQAESNLPMRPDSLMIGDESLRVSNARSQTHGWRMRLPDMEAVKQENLMLYPGVQFQEVPTMDSFAAFSGFGQAYAPSSQAATGNTMIDALSGVIQGITPAATQRVVSAIGPRQQIVQTPAAPIYQPPPAPAPQQKIPWVPIAIGGGVLLLLLVVMMSGKSSTPKA